MNIYIMTKLILSTKKLSIKERFLRRMLRIKPTSAEQVQSWNMIRKELLK